MEEIIVKTVVDKKALDAFFKYQIFTMQKSYIQCIVFALLVAVSVTIGIVSGNFISFIVAVITLAGAVMPVLTWKMLVARTLQGNHRMVRGIWAIYRWTEEGLTEEEEGREEPVRLAWNEIHKISETKQYYFIYMDAGQAFPMSKQDMSEEQIQKLNEWIKEKAPNYMALKQA